MSALGLNPLELALAPDVRAAAGGDRTAFGRLVARTRALVCSITLARIGDFAESEEVAQDVFLSAWAGLGKLRDAGSFLPWLRQLARNQATEAVRRRGRARRVISNDAHADRILGTFADPAGDAGTALARAEDEAILSDAVDRLPDEAREVLTLFYREGQSVAQVAALLGLREAAARKRLSRARDALRADLETRLGEWLAASAPGENFSIAVLSALPLGGSVVGAGASASASKAGLLGKALALSGGALFGGASGIAGVWLGIGPLMRRARTGEERRQLRLARAVSTSLVVAMSASFVVFGNVWPSHAAILVAWCLFVAGLGGMTGVVIPRIAEPTFAAERAEDPDAAHRQRRQRIYGAIGLLAGVAMGTAGLLWGLRH